MAVFLFIVLSHVSALGFPQNYEEGRGDFISQCEEIVKAQPLAKHGSLSLNNAKELSIDWCYVPSTNISSDKLILISSGVHGVEGFIGSGLQTQLLSKMVSKEIINTNTGVLFVHAVNPWGFKNQRRVTENNVDLNRNQTFEADIFKLKNANYLALDNLLNPKSPAGSGLFDYMGFMTNLVSNLLSTSKKALRQAIAGGQYVKEKGLFFGGKTQEPQVQILRELYLEVTKKFKHITYLDIHTGYGERGVLHFLGKSYIRKNSKQYFQEVFGDQNVDLGSNKDFYKTHGDSLDFMESIIPKEKSLISMTLEFGTLDSQTLLGSVRSLYIMKQENQYFHNGAHSYQAEKKIKNNFREMFYPSDKKWQKSITGKFNSFMLKIIN
ncbi:MAG: DUF2817 domain-containing protein [Bdellovibrionaceae bacterium]|nr:DUF2817 domain-containing protein [Pseudobdellovibrionaceae bacterium]